MLGATLQNPVAQATCRSDFVQPSFKVHDALKSGTEGFVNVICLRLHVKTVRGHADTARHMYIIYTTSRTLKMEEHVRPTHRE
jgi:hypothetical protein